MKRIMPKLKQRKRRITKRMKIGVLACLYNCNDNLNRVMQPWFDAETNDNDVSFVFSVVHGQFQEYASLNIPDNDKATEDSLRKLHSDNLIDFLYVQNPYDDNEPKTYRSEAEIRNKGLACLLASGVDYVWCLDGDEIYTKEQILETIKFIRSEPFIVSFNVQYRNFVFDEQTYYTQYFPNRIFSAKNLGGFYFDCDTIYMANGQQFSYQNLPKKNVPWRILSVKHLTWLNNENSRRKIEYQNEHFKHGAGCSFRWGENGLEWNDRYYEKTRQSKPDLFKI